MATGREGPAFEAKTQSVEVWGGRVKLQVHVGGSGPPLLYCHGAAGFQWDPFLMALSRHFTIYAPEHPGTTVTDTQAIHQVASFRDLVLAYDDLVRALGLQKPVVMGTSYGGMIAADLAAHFPDRYERGVLLAPLGLWRDDAPIPLVRFISDVPQSLPGLFHDPQCPAAVAMLTPPPDPEAQIKAAAAMVWALGCTGKFAWPIPDHGLRSRLHRVSGRVLIVWGREDSLVPVVYAQEFGGLLKHSEVQVIDQCGHLPQAEKCDETLRAVTRFLGCA